MSSIATGSSLVIRRVDAEGERRGVLVPERKFTITFFFQARAPRIYPKGYEVQRKASWGCPSCFSSTERRSSTPGHGGSILDERAARLISPR
jgi:hypothetical protein